MRRLVLLTLGLGFLLAPLAVFGQAAEPPISSNGTSSITTTGDVTADSYTATATTGDAFTAARPVVSNAAAAATAFKSNTDAARWVMNSAGTRYFYSDGAGLIIFNSLVPWAAEFKSTAASGSNAFTVNTNGARIDVGTGAGDYFYSNGTNIGANASLYPQTDATHALGLTTNRWNAYIRDILDGNNTTRLQFVSGGGNINKSNSAAGWAGPEHITDTANTGSGSGILEEWREAGSVRAQLYESGTLSLAGDIVTPTLRPSAGALPTCSSTTEGYTRRDSAAGGTTGARTRLCICTSDGAGTPAYAWVNLGSGTVGTDTTCSP